MRVRTPEEAEKGFWSSYLVASSSNGETDAIYIQGYTSSHSGAMDDKMGRIQPFMDGYNVTKGLLSWLIPS